MFSKSQFLLRGYFSLFIIFFFSLVPAQNNIYKINSFYITLNFAFTIIFFKYLPELLCIFSETARLMFLSNWLSFMKVINQYSFCFVFLRRPTVPICIWLRLLLLHEKRLLIHEVIHCFYTRFILLKRRDFQEWFIIVFEHISKLFLVLLVLIFGC